MKRPPLVPASLVLLLVSLPLAAAPAWAQDRPPIPGLGGGNDGGRDKPRIRMGDDPDPAPEPKRAPDATPEVDAAAGELDQLIGQLASWPSSQARQASIRLAAHSQTAFPRLLALLNDPSSDWRLICAGATTLGRTGDLRAIDPILSKLQDRKIYQHSGDLLDALIRIDPIGVKPRLLAQLLHPASAVVSEARERLESRVGPSDIEPLREIFEAGGAGARQHALGLMAEADPVAARADLAGALGDQTPTVAHAAAVALSQDASDEALVAMRRAARSSRDRSMAYGYLALGLRAEATGEQMLETQDVRTLLGGRGLDHVERLNRTVSAIVLADAGYFHEIEALENALDGKVVPRLLEAWITPDFWNDMKVVQPLVLRRLRRLTGRSELREPREWRSWWDENRRTFTARRVLASVTPSAVRSMVVTVSGNAAPGGETTVLGSSASELGPALAGELAVLLPEEDAQALATLVNESGLLSVGEGTGSTFFGRDDVRITVRAGNRERLVAFKPDEDTPGAAAVLDAVSRLRDRFRWQRYRTLDPSQDFESFVRATAPLFAEERDAAERDRTLAMLIVDAVDAKRGVEWNATALRDLDAVEGIATLLDDARVERLTAVLESLPTVDAMAEGLLRVLAATGRADVVARLLDFVQTREPAGADDLYAMILARTDESGLRSGLGDPRPEVRVAALAALEPTSLGGDGPIAARLAVEDENRWVRGAAVRTLGRLRHEDSRDLLTDLAMKQGELRIPAIEALGMLGGKASLPALMTAFVSDDPALRVASIAAFAACGEPEGYSALVFAMSGDPSPLVREVASTTIVRVGTRHAADALRKLAIDPAQAPGPRARAVSGLAALRGKEVAEDLRRLVNDTELEVGDEAALALSRWRDPAAVERLLAMLEAPRNTTRAVRALEAISLESFSQEDPGMVAALYGGWWELSEEAGPRSWLVDSLRLDGIENPALDEWADGRGGREVVPAFLRGLRSDRWFVRRACDLALRNILGRRVDGEQEAWTTASDASRMAAAWERTWAEITGQ